ncbi:MAG TPA: hypothetical protein VMI53_12910 [Opitutaceae bacterium]|nr:hypothetical protein [Opitutaceae bacterium]
MKMNKFLFALASCLAFCASLVRADRLDDLIAGLRSGAITSVDPDKRAEILKSSGQEALKAYNESMVNLYLWEIKASIVDEENHGGWPYRSFLIYDSVLRSSLTKALKARYEDKPDSILAYACICPAIYAGDDKQVADLESYLKQNDSFLYDREQAGVDKFWRPFIKSVLDEQAAKDKPTK